MKSKLILVVFFALTKIQISEAQMFMWSKATILVNTPWEITFGPDEYLWFSDSRGKLSTEQVSEGIDMSHFRNGLYLDQIIDLNEHSQNTK